MASEARRAKRAAREDGPQSRGTRREVGREAGERRARRLAQKRRWVP